MSNCVDQSYIEMIARNVVAHLTQNHVLQMSLRNCAGDWLGHESRVVECAELEGLMQGMIDNGDVIVPDADKYVTESSFTPSNNLVLTLNDGTQVTSSNAVDTVTITTTAAPATTTTEVMPTTMVGARTQVLGAPVRWILLDGTHRVPVY